MKTKKLLSSLIVGASMLASFSAMSEKFVVFSPSSNQTDYTSMFNSNYNASWQGIDNAYDALNLHAAELKFQPDSYFTDIKDRIGNKPIILELQSTDGINSLIDQFPKTYGPFTDETHQDAVNEPQVMLVIATPALQLQHFAAKSQLTDGLMELMRMNTGMDCACTD